MSKKKCKIRGCDGKHYGRGYCKKHYLQWYYHGHAKKRVKTDPNNFIFRDDICIIELFDNSGKKSGEAIIDAEDYGLVKNKKWYLRSSRKNSYVVSGNGEQLSRLHRLVMKAQKGQIFDHKDRNTLNNRKGNLRSCTRAQNRQNSSIGEQNKSGIKNVWWDRQHEKWCVEVTSNKIRYHIGRFDAIEEAELVAINARKKYHGEFADT